MKMIDANHQDLYSKEATQYDENRFASRRGQLHNNYEIEAIVRLLEPFNNGTLVLDLPGGTGRIANELATRGAEVIVADLTPQMLMVARQKSVVSAKKGALHYVNTNGRCTAFPDNSFDIVICIRFLHLLPPSQWKVFLDEIRRVAKPDARIMIQIFNPYYGGPVGLTRELYRRAKGEPGERFIWPHQIRSLFAASNLRINSISSYWLPGMGFLGMVGTPWLDKLSAACQKPPWSWVSGPYLVMAQRL